MKDIMLEELRKEWFPNLSLFLEDKALEEIMELLEELLEERKKQIDGFLKKKNEELQFDDLIQESLHLEQMVHIHLTHGHIGWLLRHHHL